MFRTLKYEPAKFSVTEHQIAVYMNWEADEHMVVIYYYRKTWAEANLEDFIRDFSGTIVCDGYAAYHKLGKESAGQIKICGCWAHSRRKFSEIERSAKGAARKKEKISLAVEALNQINQLYDIEDDLKGRPPEDIRPFCVGKKNWVMIDTVSGAEASAAIYSLAETTKANDLKPYEYFKYLLEETMAHIDDTSLDFLEDLLPWSKTLPDNCRSRQDESNTDTQNNTNAQD